MKLIELQIVFVAALLTLNCLNAAAGQHFNVRTLFVASGEIGGKMALGGYDSMVTRREANIKRVSAPSLRVVKCENGTILAFSSHSSKLNELKLQTVRAMALNGHSGAQIGKVTRVNDSQAYASSQEGGFNAHLAFRVQRESYVLSFPKECEDYLELSSIFPFKSSSPEFPECKSLFVKDEEIVTIEESERVRTGYRVSAQRVRSPKTVSSFGPSSPDSAAIVGIAEDGRPVIKAVSIEQYERERRDSETIHAIISTLDISGSRNLIALLAKSEGLEFDAVKFADRQRVRKAALSKRVMSEKALEIGNERYLSEYGMTLDARFLELNDSLDTVRREVSELEEIMATLPTYNAAWGRERENQCAVLLDTAPAIFKAQLQTQLNGMKENEAQLVAEVKGVRSYLKAIYKELAEAQAKEAKKAVNARFEAKVKESATSEEIAARRANATARKALQRQREKARVEAERVAALEAADGHKMTTVKIEGEFAGIEYGA